MFFIKRSYKYYYKYYKYYYYSNEFRLTFSAHHNSLEAI